MHIMSIGVLLAGSLLAQSPVSPSGVQLLKIQHRVDPIFPYHLMQAGVDNGKVRVIVSTDRDGNMSEWLVIGYTRKEFADASVVAIKQWKFEPAVYQGEPVGTVVEINFDFSAQGVVVTTSNPVELVEAQAIRMASNRFIYLPCSPRDLDQALTPVTTVAPHYPIELEKEGVRGKVRIDFFVDEAGAVRLPCGSAGQNNILIGLAMDALRQWKFTPPTRQGRPVLVKASQEFQFGSNN